MTAKQNTISHSRVEAQLQVVIKRYGVHNVQEECDRYDA